MRSRFSLGTLLLIVAIVAVGAASLRSAAKAVLNEGLTAALPGDKQVIAVWIGVGGLVGLGFGVVLALWNRRGPLGSLVQIFAGGFLGLAAAAQCAIQTPWLVIGMIPIVTIALAVWIAHSQRRDLRTAERVAGP